MVVVVATVNSVGLLPALVALAPASAGGASTASTTAVASSALNVAALAAGAVVVGAGPAADAPYKIRYTCYLPVIGAAAPADDEDEGDDVPGMPLRELLQHPFVRSWCVVRDGAGQPGHLPVLSVVNAAGATFTLAGVELPDRATAYHASRSD
jgi:hypothetical protein